MNIIATALILLFLGGTCYFSLNWFAFFRRQANPSVEERFLAFIILFVATISWVVLIPIYYLKPIVKIFNKTEDSTQPAIDTTQPTIDYSQMLITEYEIKSQI